ncbi:MAG: beta-ketoacyl-ACP reductase [Planctomycetaceae bacterium]|nr:beta-ketoacyl-ACP reductase [Planctomycetaceae bacterium]
MSATFENCVAVVTGGSRGIGRATALQLAREGADVAISYGSRLEPAEAVVAEIEALGRRAIHVRCDVSQQNQIDELVGRTRDELGPIDHLAHSGAISNTADHSELTYDLWFETIDVNLNGAFRIVFAVKDEMIERQRGSMVLISSVAALRPRGAQIHYASSKAGVIAMVRCCSEAFAPAVRINCIAPGLIDTEMAKVLTPEATAGVLEATPLHRLGRPEEISELTCYLLSDRSSFMTGQCVVASGGRVTLP